jgi:hypothetical protein
MIGRVIILGVMMFVLLVLSSSNIEVVTLILALTLQKNEGNPKNRKILGFKSIAS